MTEERARWLLRLTEHFLFLYKLALKHRQGKNHKMRIIAFVGSPVEDNEKDVSPSGSWGMYLVERIWNGSFNLRRARQRQWVRRFGERWMCRI